ncbi:MAG TPA: hypothetical protein VH325_01515 [Bryobacteraceae bacterium]|jgi:hypothetical protein|nr:hypothetical protein [Bryobacteraceae bacterium]
MAISSIDNGQFVQPTGELLPSSPLRVKGGEFVDIGVARNRNSIKLGGPDRLSFPGSTPANFRPTLSFNPGAGLPGAQSPNPSALLLQDMSNAFPGTVNVESGDIKADMYTYKLRGFRNGLARVYTTDGAKVLDDLLVQVWGPKLPEVAIIDALDSNTLVMKAGDAAALRNSIAKKGDIIVAPEIIALLGSLLNASSGQLHIMSMVRRGESQHGVIQGSKVLARAIDIDAFDGRDIISEDSDKNRLIDIVSSIIRLMPAGSWDVGFPRPRGMDGFYAPADVFFPVRTADEAQKAKAGTAGAPLKAMLPPARGIVAKAMLDSAADFCVMYPDGLNHMHLNVTRFPGQELAGSVYQDAIDLDKAWAAKQNPPTGTPTPKTGM